MPIGKNSKTTCARKHLLLSQPNRHVLQGGGGMFCGGPTVLPPKLVGGGMHLGGPNVPNPMAKPFGMNR